MTWKQTNKKQRMKVMLVRQIWKFLQVVKCMPLRRDVAIKFNYFYNSRG